MSMQEAGGGDQGSGVGKGQKWSTVELHCQPATGSSIIMVIFRWPSASRRQLERAEKEIEQRERHDKTAGGQREQRCYFESPQLSKGKRLMLPETQWTQPSVCTSTIMVAA